MNKKYKVGDIVEIVDQDCKLYLASISGTTANYYNLTYIIPKHMKGRFSSQHWYDDDLKLVDKFQLLRYTIAYEID